MTGVVRRNIATVSRAEREKLREAILKLDKRHYPDGVSLWKKQNAIHGATHVHAPNPVFLPWHRELVNRFEALLQQIDPTVALHYWDWQTDPRRSPNGRGGRVNLFTDHFMGSATGRVGGPFDVFEPPNITRNVGASGAQPSGRPNIIADRTIVTTGDASARAAQWPQMRQALESAHNTVHGYIGGTIGNPHLSFQDPFVFLLHSNVDRLWASWQLRAGQAWRVDPAQVYGSEGGDTRLNEPMEPWAGGVGLRPWSGPEALLPGAPAENRRSRRTAKSRRVVSDVPLYDQYVGADCLTYNPADLRIVDEGAAGWLLTDGRSRMLMLDNHADATKALALARRHTRRCFIGRNNTRPNRRDYIVTSWGGRSGITTSLGTEDLIPYTPASLRIVDEGSRGWLLTDGRSRMLMLDNQADARAALALAKQHRAQGFIGRNNTRPDRKRYIVQYWR
jgi:hypothetical protein